MEAKESLQKKLWKGPGTWLPGSGSELGIPNKMGGFKVSLCAANNIMRVWVKIKSLGDHRF